MEAKTIVGTDLEDVYTEEQCYIAEIYNTQADRTHSVARTRVLPGVTTAWHRLIGTSEIYCIVAGEGRMEVGTQLVKNVAAGDSVLIPADAPQRITNTGDGDLVFLCICQPAFEPSCYVDLESELKNK